MAGSAARVARTAAIGYALPGRLDQPRRAGGSGQVGQHGLHLAGPRQLVKAGGAGPGSGDHARAARGKPADDGEADALARAGHHGGLPCKPEVHD
jgi:hypothetical protein